MLAGWLVNRLNRIGSAQTPAMLVEKQWAPRPDDPNVSHGSTAKRWDLYVRLLQEKEGD